MKVKDCQGINVIEVITVTSVRLKGVLSLLEILEL
jgi:hypothetical protein